MTENLPISQKATSGQLPDRRRTRTEEAAATIPATWVALANEIVRTDDPDIDLDLVATARTLANLILEASS